MAKKWQRMMALARKRSTSSTPVKETDESSRDTSSMAGKGCCVVYSADGRRFEVPLAYLSTTVFSELLSISQEFRFAGDEGRITLPCEATVMEYVMCLLRREASKEIERAFLSSMIMPCYCENGLAQSIGVAVSSS